MKNELQERIKKFLDPILIIVTLSVSLSFLIPDAIRAQRIIPDEINGFVPIAYLIYPILRTIIVSVLYGLQPDNSWDTYLQYQVPFFATHNNSHIFAIVFMYFAVFILLTILTIAWIFTIPALLLGILAIGSKKLLDYNKRHWA